MKPAIYITMFLILCKGIVLGANDSPETLPPGKTVQTGRLILHFQHWIDSRPLVLNDTSDKYRNANGDDFTVTTFKYYISNISLIKANGEKLTIPDSYFLINAADSTSFIQELPGIPFGKYKGISFIIGVDSLRNFSGAQSGVLDPAKGMFWTWNSGYIFVKMEGGSSKSTAKKNSLTFHIGGAKTPANTIRTFTQDLPRTLKIKRRGNPRVDISVNAASLFRGRTQVDFSRLNFTMGGPNSVVIADNYVDGLFRVTSVKK